MILNINCSTDLAELRGPMNLTNLKEEKYHDSDFKAVQLVRLASKLLKFRETF